jgi:hypothetical protein
VVADRCEARPHPHAGRVAPGLLGRVLDGLDRTLQRLRREIGVQDDVVELASAQRESLRPERDDRQPDVLAEVRIEEQHLVLAERPVVVEDQFAVPQLAHHLREVLHLRRGDRGYAERVVDRADAATDA